MYILFLTEVLLPVVIQYEISLSTVFTVYASVITGFETVIFNLHIPEGNVNWEKKRIKEAAISY